MAFTWTDLINVAYLSLRGNVSLTLCIECVQDCLSEPVCMVFSIIVIIICS